LIATHWSLAVLHNSILHLAKALTTFVDEDLEIWDLNIQKEEHDNMSNRPASKQSQHKRTPQKFDDDMDVTNKPMLLRKSTSGCVIAVNCGQVNALSLFPSQFNLSSVRDRFQRRGFDQQQENASQPSSPTSGATFIDDAEFRNLKAQLRRTGMRSTNGVRQVLLCPASPL
jgi:hypothetical protein